MVRSKCMSAGHFSFAPGLNWLCPHAQYAQQVTKKGAKSAAAAAAAAAATDDEEKKKLSNHAQRKLDDRKKDAKIDPLLETQFAAGRLYAAISSRPGQSGRADGYVLEGKELEVRVLSSSQIICCCV
jgi:small subunit ribosomal protein S8e